MENLTFFENNQIINASRIQKTCGCETTRN